MEEISGYGTRMQMDQLRLATLSAEAHWAEQTLSASRILAQQEYVRNALQTGTTTSAGTAYEPQNYTVQETWSGPTLPTSSFYRSHVPRTESSARRFEVLKHCLNIIEGTPFTGEERSRIETKILRLIEAGAVAQAGVLEKEINMRVKLMRLKDWEYRLLTKKTLDKFSADNRMTMTEDGLRLHIDRLEAYVGNPESGAEKDRIIPDNILDKLEEAKERQLFDSFAVLWAERVPDPILLGVVNGCSDYFYIAEWGDDISFKQLSEGRE